MSEKIEITIKNSAGKEIKMDYTIRDDGDVLAKYEIDNSIKESDIIFGFHATIANAINNLAN